MDGNHSTVPGSFVAAVIRQIILVQETAPCDTENPDSPVMELPGF